MKIAVYSICKNEAQFIPRWYESTSGADFVLLGDTGSDDDTVQVAEAQLGIRTVQLHIDPWRFDDARNALLAHVPAWVDVVVALDVDEVLLPGWRDEIERVWEEGAHRMRYQFIWSWNDDGTPGLTYMADKIHARQGARWRLPVHEVLDFGVPEKQVWSNKTLIEHHPDSNKPRSQYLPLLQLAVRESPQDDRVQHYYARELYYYGQRDDAAREFKKHLAMETAIWDAERDQSMLYLAECEPHYRYVWLMRAAAEAGHMREPWVALAQTGLRDGDLVTAEYGLAMAERIGDARPVYLANPTAYGTRFEELKQQIRG